MTTQQVHAIRRKWMFVLNKLMDLNDHAHSGSDPMLRQAFSFAMDIHGMDLPPSSSLNNHRIFRQVWQKCRPKYRNSDYKTELLVCQIQTAWRSSHRKWA